MDVAVGGDENADQEFDPAPITRPQIVADCRNGIRPCPYVSCRFNLLVDVSPNGAITFNAPNAERATITRGDAEVEFDAASDAAVDRWFDSDRPIKSCLLDEVRHGRTGEEVAAILGMTRQRVNQIELIALDKLRKRRSLLATATA